MDGAREGCSAASQTSVICVHLLIQRTTSISYCTCAHASQHRAHRSARIISSHSYADGIIGMTHSFAAFSAHSFISCERHNFDSLIECQASRKATQTSQAHIRSPSRIFRVCQVLCHTQNFFVFLRQTPPASASLLIFVQCDCECLSVTTNPSTFRHCGTNVEMFVTTTIIMATAFSAATKQSKQKEINFLGGLNLLI